MNRKPALVLDDDHHWSRNIARSVRGMGGLDVVHFRSIEAFYRSLELPYGQDKGPLAQALRGFSAIVSDNNFEAADHDNRGDGWIRGINFLTGSVGPALKMMQERERPILICFAPSSSDVIANNEDKLWKDHGMVSFHKAEELAAIGLAIRIGRETGIILNREALIEHILGLPRNQDEDFYRSRKGDVLFGLQYDFIEQGFEGERDQIEGIAREVPWETLVTAVAEKIEIPPDEFIQKIQGENKAYTRMVEGGRWRGRTK